MCSHSTYNRQAVTTRTFQNSSCIVEACHQSMPENNSTMNNLSTYLRSSIISFRRRISFGKLDKQISNLAKTKNFRVDNNVNVRLVIKSLDTAIARNPSEKSLLLLMRGDALQTGNFFTEAFDAYYERFRIDPPSAQVVALKIHKLLIALSATKLGWESVRFYSVDRTETKAEFLSRILPLLQSLRDKLPRPDLLNESFRKRFFLLGDVAGCLSFDEANYAQRASADFAANLLETSLLQFDRRENNEHLIRATNIVTSRLTKRANVKYASFALLTSATIHSRRHETSAAQPFAGLPCPGVVEIYQGLPPTIARRAAFKQRSLWHSVFEGDEELKQSAVRGMARTLDRPLFDASTAARNLLTRASMTKGFWEEGGRGDLRDVIEKSMPSRALTAQQHVTRAAWFAQAGHFEDAATSYRRAERAIGWSASLDTSLSGRRSFIPQALLSAAKYDETGWVYNDHAVDMRLLATPTGGSGAVLVTCCDAKYFARYAATYSESVRRTGSDSRIHFHIVNPTDDSINRFSKLQKKFGGLSLSAETVEVEKTAYFACVRFLRAPSFLRLLESDILMTDIDVTYPRDPQLFLTDPRVLEADAVMRLYDKVRVSMTAHGGDLVYRYPRILPWSHVNAACLVLRNTPNGIAFAEVVRAEMARHFTELMKHAGSGWWADQNALLAAYRTIRRDWPQISIANVEDIGMPFGAFASGENLGIYPSVGFNQAIFGSAI